MGALDASTTRLPTIAALYKAQGIDKLQSWTLGRIANVLVFLCVLWGTCVALSFYFQGSYALNRYKELQDTVTKIEQEIPLKRALLQAATPPSTKSDEAVATVVSGGKRGTQTATVPAIATGDAGTKAIPLDAANKVALDAQIAVAVATLQLARAKEELVAIPDRLERWAASSCLDTNPIAKLALCSDADRVRDEQAKERPARIAERLGLPTGPSAAAQWPSGAPNLTFATAP